MPYKKPVTPEKLILPSDPEYWVVWKPSLTYGELKRVTLQAARPASQSTTPTMSEDDFDRGAISDGMLCAHILEWNLDDEHGHVLPINSESLAILDEEDANFLSTKMAERMQAREEERKNSSNSSGPSPMARSTAKGGRR